jgi:hypothetical protein
MKNCTGQKQEKEEKSVPRKQADFYKNLIKLSCSHALRNLFTEMGTDL